jgi:hypothetical protein
MCAFPRTTASVPDAAGAEPGAVLVPIPADADPPVLDLPAAG